MRPPRSPITTHVLDTAEGRPARGIAVKLEVADRDGWTELGASQTDEAGRVPDLLTRDTRLEARTYRLTFDTGTYFRAAGRPAFYPRVEVVFHVSSRDEHYHLPLLLSPFGYSTYRGS